MKVDKLLDFLLGEHIKTWFDLGLFLDRFREEQEYPSIIKEGSYEVSGLSVYIGKLL